MQWDCISECSGLSRRGGEIPRLSEPLLSRLYRLFVDLCSRDEQRFRGIHRFTETDYRLRFFIVAAIGNELLSV